MAVYVDDNMLMGSDRAQVDVSFDALEAGDTVEGLFDFV